MQKNKNEIQKQAHNASKTKAISLCRLFPVSKNGDKKGLLASSNPQQQQTQVI